MPKLTDDQLQALERKYRPADERMPAPAPAQPAPARLGSERLHTSPAPEPGTDPAPIAAPAREPVPATTGGQAA